MRFNIPAIKYNHLPPRQESDGLFQLNWFYFAAYGTGIMAEVFRHEEVIRIAESRITFGQVFIKSVH